MCVCIFLFVSSTFEVKEKERKRKREKTTERIFDEQKNAHLFIRVDRHENRQQIRRLVRSFFSRSN